MNKSQFYFICDRWKMANKHTWYFMITAFLNEFYSLVCLEMKINKDKTGVINDPLGQPTVPAGSDCHLILKFWDGWTYVRTDGQPM